MMGGPYKLLGKTEEGGWSAGPEEPDVFRSLTGGRELGAATGGKLTGSEMGIEIEDAIGL